MRLSFSAAPLFLAALAAVFCAGIPSVAQARGFKSAIPLKVYANGKDGNPDRYLGTTAKYSDAVSVPRSEFWYVRPTGKLTEAQMIDLAIEIREKRIPGLDLSSRWDITNDSLKPLEGIATLRFLLLAKTRVTDTGLEHVAALPGLRFLSLNNQITDKGLARLAGLKQLVGLELAGAKITDKGLSTLKTFPELQTLVLSGTQVTDAGAKTLGGLKSLLQLDISGTPISDKGLAMLKGLGQLQILTVGKRVTDAGLKPVAALKDLHTLDASEAKVTEKGIMALRQAPRLEELSLSWKTLSSPKLQALGRLPRIKRIILNGKIMPSNVLARIRALAKDTPPVRASRASS
jgi:hypothetical protein